MMELPTIDHIYPNGIKYIHQQKFELGDLYAIEDCSTGRTINMLLTVASDSVASNWMEDIKHPNVLCPVKDIPYGLSKVGYLYPVFETFDTYVEKTLSSKIVEFDERLPNLICGFFKGLFRLEENGSKNSNDWRYIISERGEGAVLYPCFNKTLDATDIHTKLHNFGTQHVKKLRKALNEGNNQVQDCSISEQLSIFSTCLSRLNKYHYRRVMCSPFLLGPRITIDIFLQNMYAAARKFPVQEKLKDLAVGWHKKVLDAGDKEMCRMLDGQLKEKEKWKVMDKEKEKKKGKKEEEEEEKDGKDEEKGKGKKKGKDKKKETIFGEEINQGFAFLKFLRNAATHLNDPEDDEDAANSPASSPSAYSPASSSSKSSSYDSPRSKRTSDVALYSQQKKNKTEPSYLLKKSDLYLKQIDKVHVRFMDHVHLKTINVDKPLLDWHSWE